MCCENKTQGNMWLAEWGTKCPGNGGKRRLQAVVEKACPKQLSVKARRLQAIQHPVSPDCTNFNAKRRAQHVRVRICQRLHRRLRVVIRVKRCPRGTTMDHRKSYTRCCHYANRRLQAPVPKYKCPVNIEGQQ